VDAAVEYLRKQFWNYANSKKFNYTESQFKAQVITLEWRDKLEQPNCVFYDSSIFVLFFNDLFIIYKFHGYYN